MFRPGATGTRASGFRTALIILGLAIAVPAPGADETVDRATTAAHRNSVFPWLTSLSASIQFEAESVTVGGVEIRNVAVPLHLLKGRAVVEHAAAKTNYGDVAVTGFYDIPTRDLRVSIRGGRLSLPESPATTPRSARLFPIEPLVPRWLPRLNGAIDVRLDRFDYRGVGAYDVTANARFDPSRVAVEMRGSLGNGIATLDWTHAYDSGETTIAASATAVELDAIAAAARFVSGATLDGTASLRGHGRTARELATGLDGTIRAQIGRGTLNNLKLERLSQNLFAMTLLSVIPFKAPAPHTPLACAALRLDLSQGHARSERAIVARSNKLELIGRGTLDLGTEQIALRLQPAVRRGVKPEGVGKPRTVSITGPLRAPVVKSSAGDLLHESIAIGTSWATTPLSSAANKVLDWRAARQKTCADVLGD